MGHNHRADQARADAPACGVGEFGFLVAAQEFDVEGLGEVLGHEMAGAALEGFPILHEGFDGVGGIGAGEFFGIRLAPLDDRNRQEFFREVGIDIKHAQGFFLCFFFGFVGGVALLPEEFRRAQEQARAQFPAHDVAPLIDQQRQIAIALDTLGIHVADDGFAGWADDEGFFELAAGL